jgi:hypothetical protein
MGKCVDTRLKHRRSLGSNVSREEVGKLLVLLVAVFTVNVLL